MSNPITDAFSKLFSGVAQSVGTTAAKAAASNPTFSTALDDLQARLDRAESMTKLAAGVAGIVVLFYFVPRFEKPIPRIWRKR